MKIIKEQFQGEKSPIPETIEDLKYKAFQEAMDEEDRIWEAIKNALLITPAMDANESQAMKLERCAPLMDLMDKAMQQSKKALQEWLDSMDKSHKQETLEK